MADADTTLHAAELNTVDLFAQGAFYAGDAAPVPVGCRAEARLGPSVAKESSRTRAQTLLETVRLGIFEGSEERESGGSFAVLGGQANGRQISKPVGIPVAWSRFLPCWTRFDGLNAETWRVFALLVTNIMTLVDQEQSLEEMK